MAVTTDDLIYTYIDEKQRLCTKLITDLDGNSTTISKVDVEDKLDIDLPYIFKQKEDKRSNPSFFNKDLYRLYRKRRRMLCSHSFIAYNVKDYDLNVVATFPAMYLGTPIANIYHYRYKAIPNREIEQVVTNSAMVSNLETVSPIREDATGNVVIQNIPNSGALFESMFMFSDDINRENIGYDKINLQREIAIRTNPEIDFGTLSFGVDFEKQRINFIVNGTNLKDVINKSTKDSTIPVFVPDMADEERGQQWIDDNWPTTPYSWRSYILGYKGLIMSADDDLTNSKLTTSVEWDSKIYSAVTGGTLGQHDYTLSGIFSIEVFLDTQGGRYSPVAYHEYSHVNEFIDSLPSFLPLFTKGGGPAISGYNNASATTIVIDESSDNFVRSALEYRDITGVLRTIDVEPDQNLRFINQTYKKLLGQNCRIRAFYKSIGDEQSVYSEYLCPTFEEYYDLTSIQLTMSGTRYDKGSGMDEGYDQIYMKTSNETVTQNQVGKTFKTTQDVRSVLEFTLESNQIDFNNIPRVFHPSPEDMYLIAVPRNALKNPVIRDIVLRIPESQVIDQREIQRRWVDYPKVDTLASSGIVDLCTGSPDVPTSDGLIWNSIGPLAVNENPNEGTFSQNSYTISTKIDGGSWAMFLIIKDSTGNFTGYCVSNQLYFELPTKNAFEV